MGYPTKIATCCYCGTKAALVLDRQRHELTCSSCGAPLHDMKRLPVELRSEPRPARPSPVPQQHRKRVEYAKPLKRKKRRKGLFRHLVEEAFDVIEDIFD